MLRKNWESNTRVRQPATCHRAIPDLSPGRYWHGVATMGYTLVVCGGLVSK